jgi:O-antigen ligase
MYSLLDFQADATGSALARWTSTVTAIEMIMERPLFGFGLGMNRLEFVERNLGWTHVHNAVLEVGADAGVPAMIVYVLILWHLFRGLHRAAKRFRAHRASEHEALAGGVQLALIAFVVATLFYPVAYHFYLFYITGFALALQAMRTSPPAPPSASRRGRVPRWLRVHA